MKLAISLSFYAFARPASTCVTAPTFIFLTCALRNSRDPAINFSLMKAKAVDELDTIEVNLRNKI